METKKITKTESNKSKKTEKGVVKKRISKFMQGAIKFKGAFDKDEVLNFVNS
jgi:hypothetical protein